MLTARDVCKITDNRLWRKDFPSVDQEYVWIYPLIRDNAFDTEHIFKGVKQSISNEISLYIHVPVCLFHCPMCRFYIEIIKNRSDIEGYENYILKELSFYERCNYIGDYQLKSIYFGGGTASLLSPDAIFKIVK
jgi:oxygen-independent coproporphyrinogen-3 oxidase